MNQNEIRSAFCEDYFTILDCSLFRLTLRSNNTNHEWHILEQEYNNKTFYSLYHRHKEKDQFHYQGHGASLKEIADKIKGHDKYQMNKNGSDQVLLQ